MSKIYFLFIIFQFLIISNTQAKLRNLAMAFLSQNYQVLESQKQIEYSVLNLRSDSAMRPWNANLSGSYSNDRKDGLTQFSVTGTKANAYSLGVEKDFRWGGKLGLSNSYERYEGTFFRLPTYGFTQVLSFSQALGSNFLGRMSRLEYKILGEQVKQAKLLNYKVTDELLLQFILDYIETSLSKEQLELQIQALKRAQKRLGLIKKWSRDGLKQKVDLYRSQLTEIQSRESQMQSSLKLQTNLERLSNHLHQRILPIDVEYLDKKIRKMPSGNFETNHQFGLLKLQKEIIQKQVRKAGMGNKPSLILSTEYETNAYDARSSETLSEGNLSGDASEFNISLAMKVPLGFETAKIERSRTNIQLMLKERELESYRMNYIQTQSSLIKQYEINKSNIQLVLERLELANKSLAEFNRLYQKGKTTLENVIQAEEDLINTQVSYRNYLAINKKVVYQLAHLYGSLKEFIFTK